MSIYCFSVSWGWHKVLEQLKQTSGDSIDALFDQVDAVDFNEDTLTLCVANPFLRPLIEKKYDEIIEAATDVWGRTIQVQLVESGGFLASAYQNPLSMKFNPIADEMTFETFQMSSANRFAHAASIAVARYPGQAYNPLVVSGDNGMGKTHLLYAIGNEIKTQYPELKVAYIHGDGFVQDLIYAIKNGLRSDFEEKYHMADVLLMDDIQFIAGKEATQEEFFHLFNYYYQHKKQIVVASDRPLSAFDNLHHRLMAKLSGGLVADLSMDNDAKLRMLQCLSVSIGVDIPDRVQKQIVEHAKNGYEVRGAALKYKAMLEIGQPPYSEEGEAAEEC